MARNRVAFVALQALLALTLALPSFAPAASTEKPIVLKMVSAFSKSSGTSAETGKMIVEEIRKKSNGALIFNWIGGPEAISRRDQPNAVKFGVVDVLYTPMSFYENMLPQVSVANLTSFTPMEERENGVYDYWVKVHRQMNVRYLGVVHCPGKYYLFINFPVKNPRTDFKNIAMRSNNTYNPFLMALGAVPKVVSNDEVYGALDSGVVNGAGSVADDVSVQKTYEVVHYWVDYGFYRVASALLMNQKTWDKLGKELQDIVIQVTREIEEKRWKEMRAQDVIYFKQFKEYGLEPITFSEEDAKWYLDTAYESKWADAKKRLKKEDYDTLRSLLVPKE